MQPEIQNERAVIFETSTLGMRAIFRTMLSFISKDETRYYLNGAQLQYHNGEMRLTATDGHRLFSKLLRKGEMPEWSFEVIIASHALRFAVKELLKGAERPASLMLRTWETLEGEKIKTHHEAHLKVFMTPDKNGCSPLECETRLDLIDGSFPDLRRVVPRPDETAPRLSFMSADVRRVLSTFINVYGYSPSRQTGVVRIRESRLAARLPDNTFDEEHVYSTSECGRDEFRETGANIHYLLACVDAVEGDWVRITQRSPGDPMAISGRISNDICVLMPVRI